MNVPRSPFRKPMTPRFWVGCCTVVLLCQQAVITSQGAGTVLAWGDNSSLQLQSPPMADVVAVSGGSAHSMALLSDGSVRAWGYYVSGQTNVPTNLWARAISAGSTFSMALRTNGTVAVWGGIPAPPAGLANVTAIAAGWSHCLALLSDQTVVSWGSQTFVPEGLQNVVAIAAGNENSLALKNDGTVVAWGSNSYGKTNVPVGLANVIAIAAGADHCLALQQGGTVVAWGRNDRGQATVPSGLNAVGIAGGALHSLALKTDGSLAAWGDNSLGQTVVNPADNGFIAVAAGGYHGLAIRGDGHPFILSQPASQKVLISKSASFQVIATGTAPLRYQWRQFGTNLAGATSSTFSIANVQPTNAGPYTVTVANDFGSITSAVAVLEAVGGMPIIVTALTNQTVICGDSTVFQASFGGSSPFTFQWQYQGTPIRGATTTSLTVTNVTQAQAGQYTITANNPYGSVSSSSQLTVTVEPPAITSALTAAGAQGVPFTYAIQALHTPTNFLAKYLPSGLLVDTNTGVISGTPAESGTFGALITAVNACSSDTETLVLTIAPSLPTITSAPTATGIEGQPFTYQITATASPVLFGAMDLPVGLSVDPLTGLISGSPTYAGTFDSTIWASNNWGTASANLHFAFQNAQLNNLNIGSVTFNYSKPYLLDFQFSLYTVNGDPADPNAPASGVVVDPKLLSATCMEDGVTNSAIETGSFIVEGNSKVVKVYLVLDFTASIASLVNGDTNNNGISDAVEFMVAGAQDFVNQQPYDTQIGVIEFHRDDMAPSNVVALTTDKVLLNQAIAGIYTNYVKGFYSGSRCWDALAASVTALGTSNRDEQHFVVFVSDGRDESSTAVLTNVIAQATTAAVKVFALGFGSELDPTTLQNITSQTQGRYFPAGSDPSALASQFAEITKSAKGQYILRWATLKRSSTAFMPSFIISYAGLMATSPTNPVAEDIQPDPADTNDPPTMFVTNYITNFIIGPYVPKTYEGDVTVGTLRMVPNKEVLPTALDLRATYAPRNISQLRIHYVPNWPCTPLIQNTGAGEILSGWSLVETNDGAGGNWMLLSSPNPTNPLTCIPFASFGKLVTFAFKDVINPTNAFSLFSIDNTLYTNMNPRAPSFRIENTNDFLKSFPLLPYGTPVPWLISYGYSGNYTNAEVTDTDGDGMLAWQEYRANTNPTNAASKFVVRTMSRLPDGRWQVTFSTSLNRTYRVEASTDLSNWQSVQDNITGINQDVTITDTRYVPTDTLYYRVLVY
ncbi:MAG TPA: putative Ig domain-containing protein [Verrucomicrobiae bacterium]